jgi:nicotinate-nucleotide adenylyltransferase
MQPVVIFGGSFNPIHHGHLIVARAVAEQLGFARITLMPVNIQPHKSARPAACRQQNGLELMPSAQDRLAMVKLAVEGEELFEVSDLELLRPPPSYTIDTLRHLRQLHGPERPLCWIVGADMLADLPNWRRADEVLCQARIITAGRPPWSGQIDSVLQRLSRHFGPQQIQALREGIVSTPLIDISSSQIRQRVAQGRSIRYVTPDSVISYINQHKLYGHP